MSATGKGKSLTTKTKIKTKDVKVVKAVKEVNAEVASSIVKPEKLGKVKAKSKPTPTPIPAPIDEDGENEEDDEDWEDASASDDSSSSSAEDEDEDDDGVDEEGMKRLMKLLGDDGLDELGKAQLDALTGHEDDDDEEDDDFEGNESASDEGEKEESDVVSGDEVSASDDEQEVGGDEENEDEEQEDAIPLDEADEVDEDAVPRQKVEIDNKEALEQIRESIKLDPSLPWTETLVLSYPQTIDVDVDDDLNRELAFYKQALHGAKEARAKAAKLNFPFTRPSDYFAEMVKSDSHMERIRVRLLDESAGIKKSEDKRKEREGKKFGKQVQVEKLKERERSKKEMEERLKGLKRKRKDVLDNPQAGGDDDFDIRVEDAISDRPAKRGKAASGRGIPRDARNKKYGFGGATRHSKSNTRESTDDFGPGSSGRGRGRGRGGFGGRGGRGGGGRGGFSGGGGGGGRGGFGGKGGRGGASRGGAKRLGKSRRK